MVRLHIKEINGEDGGKVGGTGPGEEGKAEVENRVIKIGEGKDSRTTTALSKSTSCIMTEADPIDGV